MATIEDFNLIFDRTQSDVDRVETLKALWVSGVFTGADSEKLEWTSDLKGSYNISDLNRVGATVEYLTELLYSMGYNVDTSPKTDWVRSDIPSAEQLEIYRTNIETLRNHIPYVAPNVPTTMNNPNYTMANNIEEILYHLGKVLEDIQSAYLNREANTLFMISGGVFNS